MKRSALFIFMIFALAGGIMLSSGISPTTQHASTLMVCDVSNFYIGFDTRPREVVIGDFNGDGKQDLATANGASQNVSVLLGNGIGGFGTATIKENE